VGAAVAQSSRAARFGSHHIDRARQNAVVDDTTKLAANQLAEIVAEAPFVVLVLDEQGVIRYANPASEQHLGYAAAELVGTPAFERIHPDDLDRALLSMRWLTEGNAFAGGVTSFRALHADGTWRELEVVARATQALDQPAAVIWCRPIPDRQAVVEDVIHGLVAGESPEAVLLRVCDFVLWREWATQVGISWTIGGSPRWCSTGAPRALLSGMGDGSPWDRARISRTGIEATAADLDAPRRELAAELGVAELWVEPLDWGGTDLALITVLTTAEGLTPAHHAFGVSQIRTMTELVLRWTAQSNELERSARTDSLTGLANRRSFFERLDAETGPGAIVFCDLDDFKPVNDELGHGAGDIVLRRVADRIAASVPIDHLVARLGGDEFAVLCPGLDEHGAEALAQRLRQEVDRPIDLDGTVVAVHLSVGVAHTDDVLDDDTVNRADVALYAAKRGRPTIRRPPARP
jgi:diguanylate cyclase (GGDEF)-like protein/PAS domain S-box-containing protein